MRGIYKPTGKAREFGDLALNLYEGCSHGCKYCYAPGVLRMTQGEFSAPWPRKNILLQLRKDAIKHRSSRTPIFLCFTCDPYQPAEDVFGVTRSAMEILYEYGCAINILTKGGLRACKDFDILASDPESWFGTTLTYSTSSRSASVEPGAAPPGERIAAIRKAKNKGIKTWVSLEPIVNPQDALDLIHYSMPFVDLYKIGKMNHRKGISEIALKAFLSEAIGILTENKKDYYIKLDTRPYLGDQAPEWRKD